MLLAIDNNCNNAIDDIDSNINTAYYSQQGNNNDHRNRFDSEM